MSQNELSEDESSILPFIITSLTMTEDKHNFVKI